MSEQILDALEHIFLALSDKTRLRLLLLMADGEVSVGFLADSLGESQPKISRHLAYLRNAGVVSTRRDGKWVYYAISEENDPAVERMITAALRTMGSNVFAIPLRPPSKPLACPEDPKELYAEPYMSDWAPTELEVFLL